MEALSFQQNQSHFHVVSRNYQFISLSACNLILIKYLVERMVVGWRSSLELVCEFIKLVREILHLSVNFINLCIYQPCCIYLYLKVNWKCHISNMMCNNIISYFVTVLDCLDFLLFVFINPKYLFTDISQEAPNRNFPSVA